MSKLTEIKDQYAMDEKWSNWKEMAKRGILTRDVDEVARRYATVISEDVRKRAAEQADVTIIDLRELSFDDIDRLTKSGEIYVVDKQSILLTPINLDL